MSASDPPAPRGPSRRDFLRGAVVGVAAGGLAGTARAQEATPALAGKLVKGAVTVTLRVDGQAREVVVEPRTTLLDALRDGRAPNGETVDVTGPKRVCDRGSCGACTVLLDSRPVYACSVLAVEASGREIRTVAGVGSPEKLHAVQEEFVRHDALMCGFCTPGFVVAATALLERNPNPTREEIAAGLDGNVCRCGTYTRIFEAVEAAAARLRGGR